MARPPEGEVDRNELLLRLGLALAIGFLVGIERGWKSRGEGEGERAAGLRTFSLIGLSGGIWALLAKEIGAVAFAAGYVVLALAVAAFRWRETQQEGTRGATTLVAALLTFAIGAYAVVGDMTVAAAAGVAMVVLLAAKTWLHAWVATLEWREIRAALILLAMTFVALPILPNRGFGPYEALNPYSLWVMAIAIAGVSFIGYVAVKGAGERFGAMIAGVAGGIVSSTVTTIDLARKAKATPSTLRFQLGGAMAASATMFLRVGAVVSIFGTELLPLVVWPLAAAAIVSILSALVFDVPHRSEGPAPPTESRLQNPFEIKSVLLFALLLAAMLVISRFLTEQFDGRGGVLFAAVAGISDVDAITLSMTELAGKVISHGAAAIAVLTAVLVNSLSKAVLGIVIGGPRFGLSYLAASAVALAAGGVAIFLTLPAFSAG
jgi:uncharacterized membrane protein (DUF4010 family)